MTMPLADILSKMYPTLAFSFRGNDLATAEWIDWPQGTPKPTQADVNAFAASVMPGQILADQRAGAIIELASPGSNATTIRGILLLAMNELNLLREWIESFKAATAAATTLADLKTRVAALPAMPDRTAVQLKTAVQAIINAGTAD